MPPFGFRLDGLGGFAALQRRLQQAPRQMQAELEGGLTAALAVGVAAVRERAPRAKRTGKRRPGRPRKPLRDTIRGRITGRRPRLSGVIESTAPHALYVEEDTAPHEIRPRRKKALRFTGRDGEQFAAVVQHPGTTGQHMFARGLRAARARMVGILAARTSSVTRRLRAGR